MKFLAGTHFQFNASVIIITYLNSHRGLLGDRNRPSHTPRRFFWDSIYSHRQGILFMETRDDGMDRS